MHEESNGATDPFNALCKTIHWTSAVKSTLYTPMEHASDNIIFMVHCAKTGHLAIWPSSRSTFRIPASHYMKGVYFLFSLCRVFTLILNIYFTWKGIKDFIRIRKFQFRRALRRSYDPVFCGKREPVWDYPVPCPVTSWKPPVTGTLPHPWGRLFQWMIVLTEKKFFLMLRWMSLST